MARFGRSTEDDLRNVLKDKNDCSTEVSWKIFTAYLKETSSSVDPQTITKEELNELLKNFYFESGGSATGEVYNKTIITLGDLLNITIYSPSVR